MAFSKKTQTKVEENVMDELLKDYNEKLKTFNNADSDLRELTERKRAFLNEANQISATLPDLEKNRQEVLTQVVLGKSSEDSLTKVKAEMIRAQERIDELKERAAIIDREIPRFKQEVFQAEKDLLVAWRGYWFGVKNNSIEEAALLDLEPIYRAYNATKNLRRTKSYEDFITDTVAPVFRKRAEDFQPTSDVPSNEPNSSLLNFDDRQRAQTVINTRESFEVAWGLEPRPKDTRRIVTTHLPERNQGPLYPAPPKPKHATTVVRKGDHRYHPAMDPEGKGYHELR